MKLVCLVRVSHYVLVASVFENNHYAESCKIPSFILPILSGSCTAGLESRPGLKWCMKQSLWPPGAHDLLHTAAWVGCQDADAPGGLVLWATPYFCSLLLVQLMCVPMFLHLRDSRGIVFVWNTGELCEIFMGWLKILQMNEGKKTGVGVTEVNRVKCLWSRAGWAHFLLSPQVSSALKLENRMREEWLCSQDIQKETLAEICLFSLQF